MPAAPRAPRVAVGRKKGDAPRMAPNKIAATNAFSLLSLGDGEDNLDARGLAQSRRAREAALKQNR